MHACCRTVVVTKSETSSKLPAATVAFVGEIEMSCEARFSVVNAILIEKVIAWAAGFIT